MSRCTMPRACAAASAAATCVATWSASRGAIGPLSEPLAQGVSLHELADDERTAVDFAEVVNDQDVRVIDRRCRARFGAETPQAVRIRSDVGGQQLQRDLPVELRVVRPEHFAHAAGADLASMRYEPKTRSIMSGGMGRGMIRRLWEIWSTSGSGMSSPGGSDSRVCRHGPSARADRRVARGGRPPARSARLPLSPMTEREHRWAAP